MVRLLVRNEAGKNILFVESSPSETIATLAARVTSLMRNRLALCDLRNLADDILNQGLVLPQDAEFRNQQFTQKEIEQKMGEYLPVGNSQIIIRAMIIFRKDYSFSIFWYSSGCELFKCHRGYLFRALFVGLSIS